MRAPYGVLIAGFNILAVNEDEFNDWYDTEHIPERARIKGFINAQRWLGAYDPKISIATYDLENIAVLEDPAYTAISGAKNGYSPWTKRLTGKAQRLCRFVAEQIVPGNMAGPDQAGGMLLFATNVMPGAESAFMSWYSEEHLPDLAAVPGCLCARYFRTNGCTHKHVALFHLTGPEVQASRAWEAAVSTRSAAEFWPQLTDELRIVLRRYTRKA